jgi:ABC-type multidrug transport system permease subunit
MNFIVMPLFFLSGAIFPLPGLPLILASLVRINPLTYGVDGLRIALIGQNQFPMMVNFGLLFRCQDFLAGLVRINPLTYGVGSTTIPCDGKFQPAYSIYCCYASFGDISFFKNRSLNFTRIKELFTFLCFQEDFYFINISNIIVV